MDTSIVQQPTGDGFDTLYSTEYQQTYHSKRGALIEAEYVFFNGTGVKQRLIEGLSARILEIGFGTGLNFWLTAYHSRLTNTLLHYVALEKNLLPAEVLTQLNHGALFEGIAEIRQAFLDWRTSLSHPVPDKMLRWDFSDAVRLELILGDATQVEIPQRGYHAVYHDAFSPNVNPELWAPDFFARLYAVMSPGGKLATYSARGLVRRNMQAAGFYVQKLPGPPGKREMIVGTHQTSFSTQYVLR